MRKKVEAALEKIRPVLKADDGDMELIDVTEDGRVTIRLTGACPGCLMSQMTLHNGIERVLREKVPAVRSVSAA